MFPSYHAHIYYQPASREDAAWVREQLDERFTVALGRWREEPVGPHPLPMYQVAFDADQFPSLVPWLMANRRGLDIMIHPNSGDEVGDHEVRALWLGKQWPLNIQFLRDIQHLPPEEHRA